MNNETKYEFKGTKGPFTANHDVATEVYRLKTSEISAPLSDELGQWVAYVRGENTEQRIANANLFAASQLLLSALIDLLSVCEENPSVPGQWWSKGVPTNDQLNKAKSAIEAAVNLKTVEK